MQKQMRLEGIRNFVRLRHHPCPTMWKTTIHQSNVNGAKIYNSYKRLQGRETTFTTPNERANSTSN